MSPMKKIITGLFLLALATSVAMATPTVGYVEEWTTPGQADGWEVQTSIYGNLAITEPGGQLLISAANDGLVPGFGIVSGSGGGPATNFTGNYSYLQPQAQFYFQTYNAPADYVGFVFKGGYSGTTYVHYFGDSSYFLANQTYGLSVNMGFSDGYWSDFYGFGPFTDSSTFALDLASVQWIGVAVGGYNGFGDPDQYGLDNFKLVVPEPETVWLMLAVALSMAFTFRSRLRDLAGQFKGRMIRA